MDLRSKKALRTAWWVWSLGALFYLMAFFQRVAPAVMTDVLMREFHIDATALGHLSGVYFYSYVAMQIPTGIIADAWGPRRLLSCGALVAGLGTLLFAMAEGIWLAGMGRLLIGGSVAVAFVGLLKLANNWFPRRYFSLAAGMALLVGIIGAVCAGPPLRMLVERFSWRPVILGSAAMTFAIGMAIWLWVRDWPQGRQTERLGKKSQTINRGPLVSIFKGLAIVFSHRNTLLLFIIPAGVVGPILAFSGLWGVPFLTSCYGVSATQASALTTALLVAWALGGPVCGWLSDHLSCRKPIYIVGLCTTLTGWSAITYIETMPIPVLAAVMVVTGFSSGCMILTFAFAKESVPSRLAGTVTGVSNMGVMMGPMLLQPGIGWVLDQKWTGVIENNVRVYGLEAYKAGFALMMLWAVLALVLLFFTRETHCRQSD